MRYRKHIASLAIGALAFGSLLPAQDDLPVMEEETSSEMMDEGTTELPTGDGENVELTVGELEQLLNLPSAATLREIDIDPSQPSNLFTQERIAQIFQGQPDFVYLPKGQDPMIIPWVRMRVMAQELWQDATIAVANRDYQQALEILRRIREQTPNTEEAEKAPQEMARVERLMREAADGVAQPDPRDTAQAPEIRQAELPEWIVQNTTGVMMGDRPVVIVGNDFLRVGDVVPRYAAVRVKSVSESEVVYVYQNKEFNVEVVGSF